MARATAHPDHQCISSEDIQGTTVYGADGSNIGEIDHLIIDKLSGRVAYAVMSFGGFMGLGHSHYPIPWGALTYDKSRLGSSDPSSLRCAGILGDASRHVIRL
jgi:hypothetical protein